MGDTGGGNMMITVALADISNFGPDSLDDFQRYQEVQNIYRLAAGELVLIRQPFVDDWPPERRREKAAEVLSGDFITYCAFDGERVVGQIMLVPKPDKGRLIVDSFHVSKDYRRRGIGRMLFEKAKGTGRERNAGALYISACPAEETIRFYLAMGCQISKDPIPFYVEEEPGDIQMECRI